MGYQPQWNGYRAKGLTEKIQSSAAMGKRIAFSSDSLRSADDVFRQKLEIAEVFDDIQTLIVELRGIMEGGNIS